MFDKYLAGFRERVRGNIPWNNYSAYEIRIIGALVRLGKRDCVQELLAFFLADRRIPPWNQWPEISWRDPTGPQLHRRYAAQLDRRGIYPLDPQPVCL